MDFSLLKESCPNCHEEQLSVPVFPTGRLTSQTTTPLVRIMIFREGPIPPDGEYIQELLEHFSPDALETPGIKITAFPEPSWPDDMTGLAMALLIHMEGDGKLPPGSLSSAIHIPFQDKHGIRGHIVKVPQPSPAQASPDIDNQNRSAPENSRETRQVERSEQVKDETLYKRVRRGLVYAALIDSLCVSIALSLLLHSWLVLGGGILGGLILTGITALSAKNENVIKQAIWRVSLLLIFPLAWGYAGWLSDSFLSHMINFLFLPQVLALVGFVAGSIGYTATCTATVGEDYSK